MTRGWWPSRRPCGGGPIFSQLCNVLDTRIAVAFSSASSELRAVTQAPRQQLRADHEAAAALCLKLGMRSCKELREREAKTINCFRKGLSPDDLATLGTLGSVLPALESLSLNEPTAGPDGVPRLVEKLDAGALPAVTYLDLDSMHMGDAGASAFAAALGRGALPRLKSLHLHKAAIGDAGLVALAPALRRRPHLQPAVQRARYAHRRGLQQRQQRAAGGDAGAAAAAEG